MRTILAALLIAFAGPAFAGQCPALWAQIDAKMASADLSAGDKAKVAELRRRGEAEHRAGSHAASEATLKEALALLQ